MHHPLAKSIEAATAAGGRYHVLLERRRLELGMYLPNGDGTQTPHDRDELYIIARGTATFTKADRRSEVATGDALHVAANIEHGFSDLSEDFAAWVVFDREPAPRLVPEGFVAPTGLDHASLRLRPLDIQHNERDHAAWTSSMGHIQATPGFIGGDWPHPMSLEENLGDLAMHASHAVSGYGFTYTVLGPEGPESEAPVIGCVYLYSADEGADADVAVRTWVTADVADLDGVLDEVVWAWLGTHWPWPADRIHRFTRDG